MSIQDFTLKMLHSLKRYRVFILLAITFCLIAYLAPMSFTFLSTRGERYDLATVPINKIPYHNVAIVFGAGIQKDATPTPYLRYRIETAAKLYKARRVSKLLMTADNGSRSYNEPVAMKNYAKKLGVPARAIVLDYAGFNTYDSCYRAHDIFGIKDATLISQGYHLPRAMTTCRSLGIKSAGVIAVHPSRDFTISYILREFLSTDKMVFQQIFKPHPTALGKPEPINN
jgi:vancomycin permeability regulator SanA